MRSGRPLFFVVGALGTLACSPGIGSSTPCAAGMEPFPVGTVAANPRCPGACDPVAARAVVYRAVETDPAHLGDDLLVPAYAGQAVVFNTCTGSCHASSATGMARLGAPAELDFDLDPIATATDTAALDVLLTNHHRILDHGGAMWGSITGGTMPPGPVGLDQEQRAFTWPDSTELLARLSEPAGREILRNWLACGAPFVDRSDLDGALATCPAGETCEGDYVASVAIP